MVIMGFDFKSLKDEIMNSSSSPSLSQKKKRGEGILDPVACFFLREPFWREKLLSRNTQDPTVGGLRGEKEKRFTRSRLHVDSGIVSF